MMHHTNKCFISHQEHFSVYCLQHSDNNWLNELDLILGHQETVCRGHEVCVFRWNQVRQSNSHFGGEEGQSSLNNMRSLNSPPSHGVCAKNHYRELVSATDSYAKQMSFQKEFYPFLARNGTLPVHEIQCSIRIFSWYSDKSLIRKRKIFNREK